MYQKLKKVREKLLLTASVHIRSLLKNLHSCESMDAFDKAHEATCKALVADYEGTLGVRKFTYGNAQKWVNMTLKYMYLLDGIYLACGRELWMHKGIERCRNWLHVPIDSYIMEALYREIELPRKENSRPSDKIKKLAFNTVASDLIPWSKWDQEQYAAVYKKIRLYAQNRDVNSCALIWENAAWIEVAKRRKDK